MFWTRTSKVSCTVRAPKPIPNPLGVKASPLRPMLTGCPSAVNAVTSIDGGSSQKRATPRDGLPPPAIGHAHLRPGGIARWATPPRRTGGRPGGRRAESPRPSRAQRRVISVSSGCMARFSPGTAPAPAETSRPTPRQVRPLPMRLRRTRTEGAGFRTSDHLR